MAAKDSIGDTPKRPVGHPPVHDRAAILDRFDQYIAITSIPIVAEFAARENLTRAFLYDAPEFADAIKRCITKKESGLERAALEGAVNCSMAIFSLKQIGWSDKTEQTHKGDPNAPLALVLNGSDVNG